MGLPTKPTVAVSHDMVTAIMESAHAAGFSTEDTIVSAALATGVIDKLQEAFGNDVIAGIFWFGYNAFKDRGFYQQPQLDA